MIEPSDTVYHKLSKREWYVLGKQGRELQVIWPPNVLNLSDCVLLRKGTGLLEIEERACKKMFGGGNGETE
jgi:hypothetical protein